MTKWMLALGAAAMAITAPALADPGGGKGGGGGPKQNGGGGNAHGGGGKQHGGGQPMARQDGGHRGGGQAVAMRGSRGGGEKASRGDERRFAGSKQQRAERPVYRQRAEQRVARDTRRDNDRRDNTYRDRRDDTDRDRGRTLAVAGLAGAGAFAGARYAEGRGERGLIDGCPPGLAAKNNGCLPPGQVRQQWGYGAPIDARYSDDYLPDYYRSWYPDDDRYYYRYNDGYVYRVERSNNFLSGLFPLQDDGYYYPGEYYPAAYDFYNVPRPYQRYYPDDGGDWNYRYGDGAIYQVDRSNGSIDSIVALLTGGGFGVGDRMPQGYDAYNLPLDYRDRYADNDENIYRYADGNIYQADAKTQIIQAIISALV